MQIEGHRFSHFLMGQLTACFLLKMQQMALPILSHQGVFIASVYKSHQDMFFRVPFRNIHVISPGKECAWHSISPIKEC